MSEAPINEDIAHRLRSLAKEYSQGHLSLEGYRRVRAPLLDSLAVSQRSPAAQKLPPPSTVSRAWDTNSRVVWFGLLILCALVAGALSGWLFRDRANDWRERTQKDNRHADSASAERIFRLVVPLLNDPDWTEARIAAVNVALLEEGSRHIAAQRRTEWFQRFAEEVRHRLEEQKALKADRAAPERSSLAALAVTIGLDLNSPHEARRSLPHDRSDGLSNVP